ncbi:MAG: Glycosyl transferase, group 2 family protein, partial [uncultured Solirubrobacteraceae bacterium]
VTRALAQGGQEGGRRHAGAQRGTDAREHRLGHRPRLGRRDHPGRRLLHGRDRPPGAHPAGAARPVASAQRGLRRQSEDVLPPSAPAGRRRRRDAPPRRPVRALADLAARRADPARGARPRPRVALRGPRRGARGGHALVEVAGQPRAHPDREPGARHGAVGDAHGLSRLLARAAHGDPVPAQRPRLLLRLGGAHAGRSPGLPDRGGPDADDLLRRRVVDRVARLDGLRDQDPGCRRAPRAPPQRRAAQPEVLAV